MWPHGVDRLCGVRILGGGDLPGPTPALLGTTEPGKSMASGTDATGARIRLIMGGLPLANASGRLSRMRDAMDIVVER